MGVSFKVSKTGTRYRPKPVLQSVGNDVDDDGLGVCKDSSLVMAGSNTRKLEGEIVERGNDVAGMSGSSMSSKRLRMSTDNEVSFALNLFPDGYSVGRPSENDNVHQSMLQDMGKLLHPYDRTSETLFSAIESGRLPGDILDDIPFKYINGTLVCEVRDYRKLVPEQGSGAIPTNRPPTVKRVCLRMSLENVVKDIPLMSDSSWTYGDLMEVESQILKALQPHLNLEPSPKLDRLCTNPIPEKLDLALCSMRRKRRQLPEVTVMSNSKTQGKKSCIDRASESSNCKLGDSGIISSNSMPHVSESLNATNVSSNNMLVLSSKTFGSDVLASQSRFHMGAGTPRSMQDPGSGNIVNPSVASPAGQDMIFPYADNINSSPSFHGKRENQDGPGSLPSLNKRARPMPVGLDGMQQQPIRQHMDNFHASDMNWNNTLLQQQLKTRGIQYANSAQKFPQQAFEGVLNQDGGTTSFVTGHQGMRYAPKEEHYETGKADGSEISGNKSEMQMVEAESSHFDPPQSRLQQRLPQHALMRSNYPQTPWNNIGQHVDKDGRKEDQHQKRKSIQSPRLSSGTLVQSPLSSKSGEFSSGSVGPNTGTVTTASMVSHKEKVGMTSGPAVGGAPSLTSSANDSMQRQHQVQPVGKRRSNSLPKTPAMNGVGSPVSVSNMSGLYNANSPSVGTPPLADQGMLERFSKIEMVSVRHKLNCKRNKVDNYSNRKPNAYSAHHLKTLLSKNDDFIDDICKMPLSKSLVGGNMNVLKTRVLDFVQPERVVQGNVVSYVPKSRTTMIMSEKSSDGTVAMLMEDGDFLAVEDLLPTLPNTHMADLLAAQFSSLMVHDGYVVEDRVLTKPSRMNLGASSQGNAAGGGPSNNSAVEMQHYGETVSSQVSNEDVKPTISGNTTLNSSQNLLGNTRMLPPGNTQALQMSQGLLSGATLPPRPQQLDSQPSLQQQQQQQQNQHSLTQQPHSLLQRSMMLGNNPLSHLNALGQNSNMQLGNHMGNKPSSLQLQLFQQQQQQQQQQPQMQRKMIMGIGTAMGMGNVSNNMGLSGLGSAMGMGTGRGMGGTGRGMGGSGISASMTPISGMGNLGQSPMNLSQASNISNPYRSGALNQAAMLRMHQNRANMLGASQSSIPGMSGTRQMHPGSSGLSMLGQNISRVNMNPMQRAAMGPMGPPKVMAGMNMYMNQQQQHQLQQQHHQLQQQLQQHQQQETNSAIHAVVSPPQVGSPSTIGISQLNQQAQQQQQNSPQQMSQRTPMSPQQMSSGAIHALSAGNPDACPASPQLSSQTHGSVGSITTSPMDLQGVNKSNSVSNAS